MLLLLGALLPLDVLLMVGGVAVSNNLVTVPLQPPTMSIPVKYILVRDVNKNWLIRSPPRSGAHVNGLKLFNVDKIIYNYSHWSGDPPHPSFSRQRSKYKG